MIKGRLNSRLAEVGKIKIGFLGKKITSKNGKEFSPPKKLDHFRVTTTEKDKETNNFIIDKKVMSKLGETPKEIQIRLPYDDINLNFFTSYQMYTGRKLTCQGDGEKATSFSETGKKEIECNPEVCKFAETNKCKISGILSCFISCNMEIGGVYKFRTHGWNSVNSILSALEYFSQQTNGVLMGIPLKLKLVKKATAEHGNIAMVTIVLDIEVLELRQIALNEFKTRKELQIDMKLIEKKAIAAGFTEDTDNPADVQAEFYPEKQDNDTEQEDTIVDAEWIEQEIQDEEPESDLDADADKGFHAIDPADKINDFYTLPVVKQNETMKYIISYLIHFPVKHKKAADIIKQYLSDDTPLNHVQCTLRWYMLHDVIAAHKTGDKNPICPMFEDKLKTEDYKTIVGYIKECSRIIQDSLAKVK